MNRRVILIGAGVLLVVMVILLIKIRSTDTSAGTRSTDPVATDTTPAGNVRRQPSKAPVTDSDGNPVEQRGSDDYVETVVNGVRVRDHRKIKRPVTELPEPTDHRSKPLPTALVGEVNQKLAAVMKECTQGQIPKDARGPKPKLEGTVVVDVKSGTLTVTESTVQIRDVTSDTAAVKQCFEHKVVGQNIPAGTTEDTAHYSISLSYRIPES